MFATVTSLVQLITTNEMRGRVMSVYNFAFRGGMPMGNLVSGWLVPAFTAPVVLGVNGLLLILVAVYLRLCSDAWPCFRQTSSTQGTQRFTESPARQEIAQAPCLEQALQAVQLRVMQPLESWLRQERPLPRQRSQPAVARSGA